MLTTHSVNYFISVVMMEDFVSVLIQFFFNFFFYCFVNLNLGKSVNIYGKHALNFYNIRSQEVKKNIDPWN